MKNVKKIVALLLAMVMVIGLVACGNKDDKKDPVTDPTVSEQPSEQPTEDVTDGTEGTEEGTGEEGTGEEEAPVIPELSAVENQLLALSTTMPMEFPVMTWALDLTAEDAAEQVKVYTGLDSIEGVKAVGVTEAMMNAQAFSVVLVELDESADAKAIEEAMKAGINPSKWVCVTADDLATAVVDNYVMLAMMSTEYKEVATATAMVELFAQQMADGIHAPVGSDEPVEEVPAEDETPAEDEATTEGEDAPAEGEEAPAEGETSEENTEASESTEADGAEG